MRLREAAFPQGTMTPDWTCERRGKTNRTTSAELAEAVELGPGENSPTNTQYQQVGVVECLETRNITTVSLAAKQETVAEVLAEMLRREGR